MLQLEMEEKTGEGGRVKVTKGKEKEAGRINQATKASRRVRTRYTSKLFGTSLETQQQHEGQTESRHCFTPAVQLRTEVETKVAGQVDSCGKRRPTLRY